MTAQQDIGRHTENYTTFTGSDIVCTFAGVPIASLSAIMWSTSREKAPVYTMGSPNPRSFSRGKRGIAGTLRFTMFDRPSLYTMLEQADEGEIRYFTRSSNQMPGVPGGAGQHRGIVPVGGQATDVVRALPYYADQIPPFDVTITFLNEYGQAAVRSIYGVEIINEGSGVSMEDTQIEETMTFVARDCGPMIATETKVGGDPLDSFRSSELGTDFDGVYTPGTNFG